jgi:uncharacterized delta-60 repeat protein
MKHQLQRFSSLGLDIFAQSLLRPQRQARLRSTSAVKRLHCDELEDRTVPSNVQFFTLGQDGTLQTPLGVMLLENRTTTSQGTIVTGTIDNTSTNHWDFAVARLAADGTLDPTFGDGGVVDTPLSSEFSDQDEGFKVLVQPNGQIVAIGSASFSTNSQDNVTSPGGIALIQYNTDGSLDTSFGTGGIAITQTAGAFSGLNAAFDANGNIVVTGSAANDNGTQFLVARYTADGQLDTSFGTGGIVELGSDVTGATANDAEDLAIQPDGKIIVVGMARTLDATPDFALLGGPQPPEPQSFSTPIIARFNTDGGLDTSFGNGGLVTVSDQFTANAGDAVTLAADGTILVEVEPSGTFYTFNSNGQPQTPPLVPQSGGTGTGSVTSQPQPLTTTDLPTSLTGTSLPVSPPATVEASVAGTSFNVASPNGKKAATVINTAPGGSEVSEKGKVIFKSANAQVGQALFSPNGQQLALAVHTKAGWEVIENGKVVGVFRSVGSLTFSANGSDLAFVASSNVKGKIVNEVVENGKVVKTSAAAFSDLQFAPKTNKLTYETDRGVVDPPVQTNKAESESLESMLSPLVL